MKPYLPAVLGAALLWGSLVAPQPAHADAVNVPAFTAMSEPNPEGIEVREGDGIYNWTDQTQSAVWYGDLRDKGDLSVGLKLTLPAGQTAHWRLSVVGQNPAAAQKQSFSLEATVTGTGAEQTVDFGTIGIAEPGFYRLALQGLLKSGPTFGDIKTLVLDGPASASIVSKQGFNFTHWRGQTSAHFTYQLPKDETYTAFYNEVTAITDPTSSYYCAIGFGGGYLGMQVTSPTERRVIFSIWDNASEGVSRSKVEDKDRAGLLASGTDVFTDDFGGEGTGGHSHFKIMWKTGEKQRFLVTVKPDGAAAIFAGYYYRNDLKKWMLVSAWRRPRTAAKLTGFYSFNEDFNHAKQATRRSSAGNAWVRKTDGSWEEVTTARFTRTAQNEPVRRDWMAGTDGDQLWMQIGGYIDRNTEYGDLFTRQKSNRQPTDLVLPPLPDKMPPLAAEKVLAPAIALVNEGKIEKAKTSAREIAAAPDASAKVKAMALDIESINTSEPRTYPSPSELPANQTSAFLSNLAWLSAEVGYGKPYRNRAMVENPASFPLLRSEGQIFEKGIFAHAPSHLIFDLGLKWQEFTALGGLQHDSGSVKFVVKGDGREIYHSSLIQGEATCHVKLNVTNVKTLELITEDGGDGNGGDWSVWFNPQLTR